MRKRKGNLLQRTMASLLSAVLITGMALDAVPLTVLAQENGGGYNPTEEATETESGEKESIPGSEEGTQESDGEETAADSATEETEELEETQNPVENPEAGEQDNVSEQEPAGPAAEDEEAAIIDSSGVQPDEPAGPQKAVRAASAAVQAGNVTPIKGTGWAIDSAGKLTIESDDGMNHWTNEGKNSHAGDVKSVEIEMNADSAVETIMTGSFQKCANMESITIPGSVKAIEKEAFIECEKLKRLTIPNSVESIGESAFSGCRGLEEVTLSAGMTTIGQSLFNGCRNLSTVSIPFGIKSIVDEMFRGCENLKNIDIPNSVESIGESAFSGCKGLTEITIPSSVTSIGGAAFQSCQTLASVTMERNTPPMLKTDEEGNTYLFASCQFVDEKEAGIKVPAGSVDAYEEAWPEWADYITDGTAEVAGEGWTLGKDGKLTIKSAKGMADWTFYGRNDHAGKVKSVEIKMNAASAVETIEADSFRECSELESITIPNSVKTIAGYALMSRKKLTKITIPASVESIGPWAFMGCSSLESVTMERETPPTLGIQEGGLTEVFRSCKFVTEKTKGIKVPEGTEAAYKKAWPEWKDYIADGSTPDTPTDKEKLDAAKKAVEAALKDITVSNTTTQDSLAKAITEAVKSALEAAGIDSKDVTVEVENFVKTEATTEAAGTITASIKITSGTETAEVPLSKAIDRLPDTAADKVAAVRKAVEEALKNAIDRALADTEVTNNNADEIAAQIEGLIPDAVAGALKAAGVNAGDIEFGEAAIRIEPAADREGSITVTIPVTSREDAGQSENASVQVPVAKQDGEKDPDKEAEEAQKAVEDALKNITVTNDTTPEDILAALKEELGDKAGAEAIEKFDKTDATEDAPGNISLSIRITINGKTVIVHVTVTIAQLTRRTGVYVRFMDQYDMDGTTPRYKYTGLAIRPAVRVYNNEELLTPGTDYTVGYKNNTKPGAAALTVKGKGRFSGTSDVVSFTIINADIEKDTEHPTEMTVIVNTKVAPVIMNGTKKLTTKDYELEGEGLVNNKYAAATAEGETKTLTVKGAGSYAGSSFAIRVKVIEKSAVRKLSVAVDSDFRPVYDGNALDLGSLFRKTQDGEGAITVTDAKEKTKILREGTDFTVQCTSDLMNAGTVRFTLTGMGAYAGSVTKSFKISPLKVTDSSRFSVTFDEGKTYEYRAAGTEVDGLVVKYLGETDQDTDARILIPGVDYKVTYSNNKKVSGAKDAVLKVTFLGSYRGSSAVQKTFKIVPAKLSSANTVVTVPDKVYNKAARAYKSVPIVTVDGSTIKASGYTVSYAWATASQAADDTKYVEDNKVKITIAEGDSWAKVRVTVTPKEAGSYGLAEGAVLAGEYYVRKADGATDLSRAKVTFFNREGTQLKWLEYNGNTFYTPAGNNAEAENAPDDPNAVYVRVTAGGAVVDPSLYDVTWTSARDKGRATVVICGKGTATDRGMAVGSRNQAVTIKAMVLKGKNLKPYVEDVADMMNSIKNLFFKKQ